MKKWIVSKVSRDEQINIHNISEVPELITKLLYVRGINRPEEIRSFMNPDIGDLQDPFLLKDMDKAIDRIVLAIAQKEKILIYGDYDVDGVTSSSLLFKFFKKLGIETEVYIPSRFDEGYGLSFAAIENIKDKGYNLIITVDCGIASIDEVKAINALGIDIIVTDHHQCQEELPDALAVINPHRVDCEYPFKELCGVGVAYKLISALSNVLNVKGIEEEFIDIVALGTVADIVPLLGENRIFVYLGLLKMNKFPCTGINALIETAGLKSKEITSYSIAFGLAPRINAAGRLGDAMRGVKLLTSEDSVDAKEFAMELNSENMLRQQTEGEILNEVINYIEREHDFNKNKVIVVSGKNWHHGVIGIVASKVVEKYYRPCIILSSEDGVLRGSGRSIEGFNIFHALTCCSSLLEKYGGHEMAAGLTLNACNLNDFEKKINEYANDNLKSDDLIEKIYIDAELTAEDTTIEIAEMVKRLAPFGQGNCSPVFVCMDFKIHTIRKIGDGKHLKLVFTSGGRQIEAVAFNMGDLANSYRFGDSVDIVCSLDINSYNNIDKVQLIVRDIRLCERELIKAGFYSSIENTIIYEKTEIDQELNISHAALLNADTFNTLFIRCLTKEEKAIFLVNDINEIKDLTLFLDNQANKIDYKIYVGEYSEESQTEVYIVVNPSIMTMKLIAEYNIFIYGRWLDQIYVEAIANSIDNGRLFLYNNKLGVSIFDGTGFDRDDITAIYKYVWGLTGEFVIIKDINLSVAEVNTQYSRHLKAFSFKKCLEILQEVGLISITFVNAICVKVQKNNNKGKKVRLEDSVIYRKFQSLLN